jgi:hypothetical protein
MRISWLKWVARIICILAILFVMMFSMDCFDGGYSFKEALTCFVMHNIPAFLIIISLVIAWKWEIIGGAMLIIAASVMIYYFKGFEGNIWAIILASPFLLAGALFILNAYLLKKRNRPPAINE